MEFKHIQCNICGLNDTRPVGTRRGPDGGRALQTNIVKCSHCGLMYPDPMPQPASNEVQENFYNPSEYFPDHSQERLEPFEKVVSKIEKIKPGKGRILDVGCGRGELLYMAGKRGWETVGTDISEAFVKYARNEFGVNALPGDIMDMDLPLGSFDVVCLVSVIQCLRDPVGMLKRINTLLKKDGILFIETTNEDALVFKIGDFFKSIKEGHRVTTHLSPLFPSYQIYGFNKKSLSKALKLSGFEVSDISVWGPIGGGQVKGYGFLNAIVNIVRRIVIFVGGKMGKGHLIFCIARKEEKT